MFIALCMQPIELMILHGKMQNVLMHYFRIFELNNVSFASQHIANYTALYNLLISVHYFLCTCVHYASLKITLPITKCCVLQLFIVLLLEFIKQTL